MKLHVALGEGGVHKINWQALLFYVSEIIADINLQNDIFIFRWFMNGQYYF